MRAFVVKCLRYPMLDNDRQGQVYTYLDLPSGIFIDKLLYIFCFYIFTLTLHFPKQKSLYKMSD